MELQLKLFGKILHAVSSAAGTGHPSMLERGTGIFSPRSQRCFDYSPGEQLHYATWSSVKNRDAPEPHG